VNGSSRKAEWQAQRLAPTNYYKSIDIYSPSEVIENGEEEQ
jgi:hypothetical protein